MIKYFYLIINAQPTKKQPKYNKQKATSNNRQPKSKQQATTERQQATTERQQATTDNRKATSSNRQSQAYQNNDKFHGTFVQIFEFLKCFPLYFQLDIN